MKPSHKLSHEGSRPCIAMLVWNDCRSDYRVLREAETLRNAGYRVCLFGIVKGRIGVETVRIRNLRVRLVGTGNPYHAGSKAWHLYISTIWCLSRLINLQKPDYLHAHDWSGLIPLYFYKWRYAARIPLIWDNHEIGCSDYRQLWHRFPWPWNALNMGMEWLGRRIVRRSVQSVIVVNDHLAELHRDYFRIPRPTVVMNCPESCPKSVPPEPGLRRRLNITDDRPILIFQGNFSVRRGDVTALRNLVDALSLLSRPVALLLIGNITQRPEFAPFRRYCSLTARGDRRGKGSRVYFMPPVPPETLIHYTRQATLGLMIFNLSGYSCYCLPNKFFDYLHAGLPVISGPYPPVQALLERYPCGRICRDISLKTIAETIDGMLNQPELMEQMKHQSLEASRYFTWAGESFKLIELYRNLHSAGTK